ncbi:MAG: hypothetical protein OEU90_14150 [Gammaproteobacteria bacterium]|nr:hypothetical protein [Gammaproteobacteria bacterium]MDH3806597.1 hypothetical protein [Gammaproteobacteria bacterium]
MSEKKIIKPVALAVGAALAGSFALSSSIASAETDVSPFAMSTLSVGYMLGAGEGSCGGDKEGKEAEGTCGEGSCGGDKEGEGKHKDGEATCGADKEGEASCGGDKEGEASCGGDKEAEGACGEGSCGGSKD